MKRLIIVLIFTTICGRYYVGDKHSESLSAALQAGRNRIETIVQSSYLEEELMSLPYLGFFTVRNWIIISRDSCYYHIRIGKFTNEEYSLKIIPISEDEGLSSLFELKEDLSNYTINDVYSPFYYYFVLFSNDHSSYVECNSMMNANKKSRNKKRGTLLPEEGMRVLWSLLINDYSEHLIACGTVSSMSTTSESNDYEVNDEVVYENVDVWPLYEGELWSKQLTKKFNREFSFSHKNDEVILSKIIAYLIISKEGELSSVEVIVPDDSLMTRELTEFLYTCNSGWTAGRVGNTAVNTKLKWSLVF